MPRSESDKSSSSLWLSPAKLAPLLEVSEASIRRNIHTDPHTPVPPGKIPGIRIGRQLRVHIKVFERLQEAAEHRQTVKVLRHNRNRSRGRRASRFADI